jgi:ferritin
MDYKEYLTKKIEKVLDDEMVSSLAYLKMAEDLQGMIVIEVQEVLKEHADEEFGHFKDIFNYAKIHGIDPIITVNTGKINSSPKDLKEVIIFTQALETEAINDYTEIVKVAQENEDLETVMFFKKILDNEKEHFDELAPLLGQKRPLGESSSFRDLLKKSNK